MLYDLLLLSISYTYMYKATSFLSFTFIVKINDYQFIVKL